jgi:hypothetical protein
MNVDHGKAVAGLAIYAIGAAVALWYASSHGATDAAYQTAFCLWFVSLLIGGGAVVVFS